MQRFVKHTSQHLTFVRVVFYTASNKSKNKKRQNSVEALYVKEEF